LLGEISNCSFARDVDLNALPLQLEVNKARKYLEKSKNKQLSGAGLMLVRFVSQFEDV